MFLEESLKEFWEELLMKFLEKSLSKFENKFMKEFVEGSLREKSLKEFHKNPRRGFYRNFKRNSCIKHWRSSCRYPWRTLWRNLSIPEKAPRKNQGEIAKAIHVGKEFLKVPQGVPVEISEGTSRGDLVEFMDKLLIEFLKKYSK